MEENETSVYYENVSQQQGPKDRFFLAYIIFLLQGVGILMPWEAFISAPDYFFELYGNMILVYFTVAYMYPNVISAIFWVKFGPKVPSLVKVIPAYVISFLIVILMPIFNFTNVEGTAGLVVTIICLVLAGFCVSTIQTAVFALAGQLPPRYMQAAFAGNGLAGMIVALLRVVTKLTIERDGKRESLKLSSSIYFFVSAGVIVLCTILFFVLMRLPFVQYYIKKSKDSAPLVVPLIDQDEQGDALEAKIEFPKQEPSFKIVMKKIWYSCLNVFFCMFITISLFPGIIIAIPSHQENFSPWLAVILIVVFNAADLIGRFVPQCITIFNTKIITIPNLLRLIFYPLFILCLKPRVFAHDAAPIVIMIFFAFTNGHLSTLMMILAPQDVEPHEREMASAIMTFFLLFGAVMGSNISLLLAFLLLGKIA